MFTPEQLTELRAPLSSLHVKERSQSGRKLSYVEGWHAIAEANRIFGFDAWSSETVDIKCVAENPRKMSSGDGFGVSYIARVRVTLDGIIREGLGAGHGIDRDLGLAHESAIKEAETDARKRALMTFGNPFGLALYDKTQANVADEPAPQARTGAGGNASPAKPPAPVDSPELSMMTQALKLCATPEAVDEWEARNAANIEAAGLSPADAGTLTSRIALWRAHVAKKAAA
jgi:DNA repair and recombination protein RAD52